MMAVVAVVVVAEAEGFLMAQKTLLMPALELPLLALECVGCEVVAPTQNRQTACASFCKSVVYLDGPPYPGARSHSHLAT
jgi:hypothetical protein